MDTLAFVANSLQLRLAGRIMDTWIFFLFVAIAGKSNMSDPFGSIYCAEQINIPPTFPHILKLYVKAAIRTQPYDLLRWTSAYFRALSKDECPPVKERLEYPPFEHPSGITPGYLKTLLNRFGHLDQVSLRDLFEDWHGISLNEIYLYQIFIIGDFLSENECDFYKFLAIACGFLGKNLFETMLYICKLLSDEPEGGSAMIVIRVFLSLYEYLAKLDCSGERRMKDERILESDIFCLCGLPSFTGVSSSTPDSRIYRLHAEEEEDAGEDASEVVPCEKEPGMIEIFQDHGNSKKYSDIDVLVKKSSEQDPSAISVEIGVINGGQNDSPKDNGRLYTGDYHDDDNVINKSEDDDLSSIYDLREGEFEGALSQEFDEYKPIGLENILQGICECLEADREAEREPTPPPDPFEEFLERMEKEVEEGRLETTFRVPGIGPTVSDERITAVGLWLAECARRQGGVVGPRNIRHFLCPNLDDYSEDFVQCECNKRIKKYV